LSHWFTEKRERSPAFLAPSRRCPEHA
jgi:hypothetical protein